MHNPTSTKHYGPVFAPAWSRPWLRFIVEPGDGSGAGAADEDLDDDDQNDDDGKGPLDGEEQLGDAGKKALDSMKAKWKAERQRAAAEKARADAAEAKANGQEQQHQQQLAAQQVKNDALAAANSRILKAEVRTAAKGRLTNPADALIFIDLDAIDVDDEGNVDEAAITAAIDKLLTEKPYLAAQGGQRFLGGGDGGARNGAGRAPQQLTEDDVAKMTPEQVNKAMKAGQLDKVLGVTR